MVRTGQAVRFPAAAAKMRHDTAPLQRAHALHQRRRVMRRYAAFQAMKEDHERRRCAGGAFQPVEVDEVAVRRIDALPPIRKHRPAQERGVDALGVSAGQPRRRPVLTGGGTQISKGARCGLRWRRRAMKQLRVGRRQHSRTRSSSLGFAPLVQASLGRLCGTHRFSALSMRRAMVLRILMRA